MNLCNEAKRSHDKVPSSWNVAMSSLCTDTRFVHDGLPSEINTRLRKLIAKWKPIIFTGPTDLGFTNLVENEIKLTDQTPFKESYRRIPPSMFNEVRKHP